jgi:hypothetical protein
MILPIGYIFLLINQLQFLLNNCSHRFAGTAIDLAGADPVLQVIPVLARLSFS